MMQLSVTGLRALDRFVGHPWAEIDSERGETDNVRGPQAIMRSASACAANY